MRGERVAEVGPGFRANGHRLAAVDRGVRGARLCQLHRLLSRAGDHALEPVGRTGGRPGDAARAPERAGRPGGSGAGRDPGARRHGAGLGASRGGGAVRRQLSGRGAPGAAQCGVRQPSPDAASHAAAHGGGVRRQRDGGVQLRRGADPGRHPAARRDPGCVSALLRRRSDRHAHRHPGAAPAVAQADAGSRLGDDPAGRDDGAGVRRDLRAAACPRVPALLPAVRAVAVVLLPRRGSPERRRRCA